jgi:hypothetical protein
MKTEVKKNLKSAIIWLKADRKKLDKQIDALESILTTVSFAAMVDDKRIAVWAALESILACDKPARAGKTSMATRGVPSSKWTPKMRKAAKERMRKYWEKRKLHRLNASVQGKEK